MVDCNVDNCNFIFIITLCKCMHVKIRQRQMYLRTFQFFLSFYKIYKMFYNEIKENKYRNIENIE